MTEKTFIELIQQHQGILHKVARLYARHDADRADLFQEILLQAWKSAPGFQGQAKFSTWLYRVALHTAISQYRRHQRRVQTRELDPKLPLTTGPEGASQEVEALYRAIAKLGEVDKALIMLYLDDLDYQTIGDVLGISANNVAVKMNRIKNRLRETAQDLV